MAIVGSVLWLANMGERGGSIPMQVNLQKKRKETATVTPRVALLYTLLAESAQLMGKKVTGTERCETNVRDAGCDETCWWAKLTDVR